MAEKVTASFTGVTYTATQTGRASDFTASGSDNINDTVSLPSGSTITYTVSGTISAAATGTFINTATVTDPGGATHPSPRINSRTDSDTLTPQADLQITKTDSKASAVPGTTNDQTITRLNASHSSVSCAVVGDNMPASFTGVTYTATQTGGASDFTASGSGNINDTV